jgi:hypothetical protein
VVDLAYILATSIWILSLVSLEFISYFYQSDLLGVGPRFANMALGAVFTSVYLFFIFLVWLFQRRLNSAGS